jgi:hypothetical protein
VTPNRPAGAPLIGDSLGVFGAHFGHLAHRVDLPRIDPLRDGPTAAGATFGRLAPIDPVRHPAIWGAPVWRTALSV